MILSIGMIVKDEEKYLRRCLTALTPILEQVKSELIIIDTGSNDSTVDIAKEFTSNVYHFEWCNDFSAARNSALKRAKGSWYMSIDADEILDDTKALIKFFNSGEYKNFNSAAYTVRSANDADLKMGSDFNALRLIKLKSNTRYINAVHEHFEKIYAPTKFLPIVANHYGYICENNKDYVDNKAKKYLEVMLTELLQAPSDCILYLNICNSYRMLKEFEKTLEYCDKGLTYATAQNRDSTKYALYSIKIAINAQLGNYIKAIEVSDEYFNLKQNEVATDVEIYYIKAECYFSLRKYKEAIITYKEYLKFFTEYKQGLHITSDTFEHSIDYTNDSSYRFALLRLASSYFEEKDFTNSKSTLRTLTASDFCKDKQYVSAWLSLEINLMKKMNDFSYITVLYGQLDDNLLDKMQVLVEKELDKEIYRDIIIKEFAILNYSQTNYHKLMKLRYDYYKGNITPESVQNLLSDLDEWSPLFADVIYFAVDTGFSIQSIAPKIDPSDLGNFFYNNVYYHFNDLPALVYKSDQNNMIMSDTNMQMWLSSLYFQELTSSHLCDEEAIELFIAYSKTIYTALTALFKEEFLYKDNVHLLPKSFRVGYYCYMATNCLETGNNDKYIKYLSTALKLNPDLKKVIKILVDKYENEINEKANKLSEFKAYAVKVKEAIYNLINNGKMNEAAEFIKSYEELCPDDVEIAELKKRTSLL